MSAALLEHDDVVVFTPRRCRIGLTALIDVVFILLMFFMLTSTFVRWHAVELAVPAPGATPSEAGAPLNLVLDADGTLATADGRHSLGPFRGLARAALGALVGERAIVLRPRAGADLETMIGASEALQRAGARNVALGPLASDGAGQ